MNKSMRAFGIGVFLAGAAIAGYDQFFPDKQTVDTRALEKQIKQYEEEIETLNKQLATQEPNEKEKPAETTESVEASKTTTEPTSDVQEATIYVYENVSIYTIGQQAEDLGIVENGRELELFLAKPEYARSIQKGAFDLRSDMTIEEIAKTLTGKKLE